MVETWTQLQAHRDAHNETAKSVENIRTRWTEQHDKDGKDGAATRYHETYEDVVEALRKRYVEPDSEVWFAGNETLIKDLDELFTKLKAKDVELKDIESRIAEEKRRWYQGTLRQSTTGTAAEQSIGRPAFLRNLDALGEHDGWHAATQDLQKALSGKAGNKDSNQLSTPSSDDVLAKVAGLDPSKRAEALIDLFFKHPNTSETPASCAAAIDALRNGSSLSDVISKLSAERSKVVDSRSQLEKHRRSLADLRRAQAAHEQDKIQKAKRRKQKRQSDLLQNEHAVIINDMPGVNRADIRACALCQVFWSLKLGKPRAYLSDRNNEKDHADHVKDEHPCASEDDCIGLSYESDEGEEGEVKMEVDDEQKNAGPDGPPVLCRECIEDHGKTTTYCCKSCAERNFQKHRQEVHLPRRRTSGRDIEKDSKALVYEGGDRSRYRANDINKFILGIEEALDRYFAKKHRVVEITSVKEP